MGRRRRSNHEEHENHERWLVSYADFITLLFAFFVVMYSISSINESKYKVLSDALEGIFNEPDRSSKPIPIGTDRPKSNVPGPAGGQMGENINSLASIGQSVQEAFDSLIQSGQVSVQGNEMWLEIELNSSLLFPSAGAIPNDQAFALVEQVAKILAPYKNPIMVEGFTDNQPISSSLFPTNWELSAARAASIVRLLAMHGVDPTRMSAVGNGEYKPLADNATQAGRSRNRRVVLAISRDADIRRNMTRFSEPKNPFARQPSSP